MNLEDIKSRSLLPEFMQEDPANIAFTDVIDEIIQSIMPRIEQLSTWDHLDDLTDADLTELAWELSIDWWQPEADTEGKANLIKTAVPVKRTLGTKGAVIEALGAIFPASEIEEWFEYGGEPGRFRVVLDLTNAHAPADPERILWAINLYKRLSAHLEELDYQCAVTINIEIGTSYTIYTTGLTGMYFAGTVPDRSTKAGILGGGEGIEISAEPFPYSVKLCGVIGLPDN
jgi:phage tail P2-like protein